MIFWTFQQTEWAIGGGPIAWVGDFIGYKESNFGQAINSLEVTVFSNPQPQEFRKPPNSSLRRKGIRQPHEAKLPSVVYRKKERKLGIKWQSQNLTEDEMEISGWQNATRSVFIRAVRDVHDALAWGLNERLSGRDDFDISACLEWVKVAQVHVPTTDEDLRSVLSRRSEEHLHLVRTKDFHKKFDIDWSSMHEDAAYLLYHPDLWNDTDERMPPGNQLGKGILKNFDYYENTSLIGILTSLGLSTYDNALVYDDKIKALQVELALAFAHIKKSGDVPETLTDELIRKMKLESNNKNSFRVHRSRHGVNSHFHWMSYYLEKFTSQNRRHFP
ncbi:hypothetical protein [Loktanella sp. S4079]|uniref:hypothetical protein n=1 Tax=Loktanella sp. S4079 TaxID=579483 RepID=UPI0005F9D4FD|nr:hypothetical protein [Loktanella sp. S4079]KJZ18822.1 hypothetical protein TW80_12125 [Loktanella sp. S4079]